MKGTDLLFRTVGRLVIFWAAVASLFLAILFIVQDALHQRAHLGLAPPGAVAYVPLALVTIFGTFGIVIMAVNDLGETKKP